MKSIVYIVPLLMGLMAVLQGTLNRVITQYWGLAYIVFFNGVIFLLGSLSFCLLAKYYPQSFPSIFLSPTGQESISYFSTMRWWFIIPGLCGLGMVLGMPYSLSQLPTTQVIVIFIMAQIITSILWELNIDQRKLALQEILGLLLSVAGILLLISNKK